MLRFLRNNHEAAPTRNDWLQVRLEATRGARDAIGARVTVVLKDRSRVIRVLKAGEGFLSQTSKWLHFGLGAGAHVDRVMVRWPGRTEETFMGAVAGRHCVIREGEKLARLLEPRPTVTLAAGEAVAPPAPEAVAAIAGSRLPAPRLRYVGFDGKEKLAGGKSTTATLVNLWATWCPPCLEELKQLAADHDALEKGGVRILALSVDGLTEGGTPGDPAAVAARLAPPFECARATASLARRIEKLRSTAWGVKWPLPVPASLLLDSDGRLIAMYLGPVRPAQVLADARRQSLDPMAFHDASFPFPGPWIERPNRPIPLALALDLMDEGALDDAREFVARAGSDFARHREFAILMAWIGDGLITRGDTTAALAAYESALAADGSNLVVLNNLAWQRAAHPDEKVRNGAQAVHCAEKAAELSKHQDPSVLDTLAAAYAQAGRFKEAIATAEHALTLTQTQETPALGESLRKGLGFYRRGRAYGR